MHDPLESAQVLKPADAGPPTNNPERWELVAAKPDDTQHLAERVQNSFAGSYVQVLPDDHDKPSNIPNHPPGGDTYDQITGPESFVMTGLQFDFDVVQAGVHKLSLRWAGGDVQGGGDSLYVLVRDARSGALQHGVATLKPAKVKIGEVADQFAGCCYDSHTHHCRCVPSSSFVDPAKGPETVTVGVHDASTRPCGYWLPTAEAETHGVECDDEGGAATLISDPRWCALLLTRRALAPVLSSPTNARAAARVCSRIFFTPLQVPLCHSC